MKVCRKCGGTDFYKTGVCKPCYRKAYAKHYSKNSKKIIAATKVYADSHPEQRQKIAKTYRTNHPDKVRAADKKYCVNNPERRRAAAAKSRRKHLDKDAAKSAKRRANKLLAIPKWFGELDELIIQEAHALAKQRTKQTGFKWQVDHKVPLQSKIVCGFHIGCNIQVIPAIINQSKHNRYWPDMP